MLEMEIASWDFGEQWVVGVLSVCPDALQGEENTVSQFLLLTVGEQQTIKTPAS